jgi:hypothetical protein
VNLLCKIGTDTNQYSGYNTGVVGANYQPQINLKQDNRAHKEESEKLETKLTNTYN